MIIKTKLSKDHIHLLDIFFKANELEDININVVSENSGSWEHEFVYIETNNAETELKLTFMGIRHSGILNMFDHYLLKCGVLWSYLYPESYLRQLQDEHDIEITDASMAQFSRK